MYWAIIKDAREIKNNVEDYSKGNYDIKKAGKDIAILSKK